jgi:hypothetical protein
VPVLITHSLSLSLFERMAAKSSTLAKRILFLSLTLISLVLLSQYGPRSQRSSSIALTTATNATASVVNTSPVLVPNTTTLVDFCQSQCLGGSCNQTEVGTTTCNSCATGFTLQDTGQCLDLRSCFSVSWCSSSDPVVLVHTTLLNATLADLQRPNGTKVLRPIGLLQHPQWPIFNIAFDHVAHNGTNMTRRSEDLAALANMWILGRIGMGNDTLSVGNFLVDQGAYWSSALSLYSPPVPFAAYANLLKSRVCGNNWRPASTGTCESPTVPATETCVRLTASELAQNGGVCVV